MRNDLRKFRGAYKTQNSCAHQQMYQCQSCNKFFANKQEFEKHTIKVHSEKNQYNDFSSDLPASTEEEEGRI
jgi:hypothetical protein